MSLAQQVSLTRSWPACLFILFVASSGSTDDFDAFLANGAHEDEYVRDRARIEKLLKNDRTDPMTADEGRNQNRDAQPCKTCFSTRSVTRAP